MKTLNFKLRGRRIWLVPLAFCLVMGCLCFTVIFFFTDYGYAIRGIYHLYTSPDYKWPQCESPKCPSVVSASWKDDIPDVYSVTLAAAFGPSIKFTCSNGVVIESVFSTGDQPPEIALGCKSYDTGDNSGFYIEDFGGYMDLIDYSLGVGWDGYGIGHWMTLGPSGRDDYLLDMSEGKPIATQMPLIPTLTTTPVPTVSPPPSVTPTVSSQP